MNMRLSKFISMLAWVNLFLIIWFVLIFEGSPKTIEAFLFSFIVGLVAGLVQQER